MCQRASGERDYKAQHNLNIQGFDDVVDFYARYWPFWSKFEFITDQCLYTKTIRVIFFSFAIKIPNGCFFFDFFFFLYGVSLCYDAIDFRM